MQVEPRAVTTFCPRCGRPIVWSVTPFAGGEQLEVAAFACYCALSDDEWADLSEQTAAAFDGEGIATHGCGAAAYRTDAPHAARAPGSHAAGPGHRTR